MQVCTALIVMRVYLLVAPVNSRTLVCWSSVILMEWFFGWNVQSCFPTLSDKRERSTSYPKIICWIFFHQGWSRHFFCIQHVTHHFLPCHFFRFSSRLWPGVNKLSTLNLKTKFWLWSRHYKRRRVFKSTKFDWFTRESNLRTTRLWNPTTSPLEPLFTWSCNWEEGHSNLELDSHFFQYICKVRIS